MFDVLGHSSRDDVLAWQRPLEVAFALGVLDSSEQAVLDQSVLAVIHKRGLDRDALIDELRAALQAYRDERSGDESR